MGAEERYLAIPQEAVRAAFDRYMATPDEDNDGITMSTVQLMLLDALPHVRPVPTAGVGKARVFTENDVRALFERLLDEFPKDGTTAEAVERALAGFEGELTEEVIARSAADRLVALALVWGAHDYRGLPPSVWSDLAMEGMIKVTGDPDGEGWPVLTDKGEAFLRAELERDR